MHLRTNCIQFCFYLMSFKDSPNHYTLQYLSRKPFLKLRTKNIQAFSNFGTSVIQNSFWPKVFQWQLQTVFKLKQLHLAIESRYFVNYKVVVSFRNISTSLAYLAHPFSQEKLLGVLCSWLLQRIVPHLEEGNENSLWTHICRPPDCPASSWFVEMYILVGSLKLS